MHGLQGLFNILLTTITNTIKLSDLEAFETINAAFSGIGILLEIVKGFI